MRTSRIAALMSASFSLPLPRSFLKTPFKRSVKDSKAIGILLRVQAL